MHRQGNRAVPDDVSSLDLSDCHTVSLCCISMDVVLQRWIPVLSSLSGLRCLTLSFNHLDTFTFLEPSVS